MIHNPLRTGDDGKVDVQGYSLTLPVRALPRPFEHLLWLHQWNVSYKNRNANQVTVMRPCHYMVKDQEYLKMPNFATNFDIHERHKLVGEWFTKIKTPMKWTPIAICRPSFKNANALPHSSSFDAYKNQYGFLLLWGMWKITSCFCWLGRRWPVACKIWRYSPVTQEYRFPGSWRERSAPPSFLHNP